MPQGMGVVSELVSHSLQRVPEEELVERKPSVALKIKKDKMGRGGVGPD